MIQTSDGRQRTAGEPHKLRRARWNSWACFQTRVKQWHWPYKPARAGRASPLSPAPALHGDEYRQRKKEERRTRSRAFPNGAPLLPGFLLLLNLALAPAQVPSPTNLRLVEATNIILIPVTRGASGFAAYWTPPDTNRWLAEWSTNQLDWQPILGGGISLDSRSNRLAGVRTPQLHWAETSTNSIPQWFVRIRKEDAR